MNHLQHLVPSEAPDGSTESARVPLDIYDKRQGRFIDSDTLPEVREVFDHLGNHLDGIVGFTVLPVNYEVPHSDPTQAEEGGVETVNLPGRYFVTVPRGDTGDGVSSPQHFDVAKAGKSYTLRGTFNVGGKEYEWMKSILCVAAGGAIDGTANDDPVTAS